MNGIDNVVVDTNICIYFLKWDLFLENYFSSRIIHCSFISEIELLCHTYKNNEKEIVKSFLDNIFIQDLDEQLKDITIKVRQKYKLKLPDSLIVATAIRYNCPLITADKKLFKIEEIKIIEYHL